MRDPDSQTLAMWRDAGLIDQDDAEAERREAELRAALQREHDAWKARPAAAAEEHDDA